METRYFTQTAFYPQQKDSDASLFAEFDYYTTWSNERQSLVFKPFFRVDKNDDERSHADIRELLWVDRRDNYTLKAGVGKIFWGVTEFYHLVDIINQTDQVEAPDGEDKLGQPMLSLEMLRSWGTTELFILLGFRERTFPGEKGRFRAFPPIDTDRPVYESSDEERHIDWALRWSHTLNNVDLGFSFFKGTSRDPLFIVDQFTLPDIQVLPFYAQIEQTSLDLQAIVANWLWKLEAVYRVGQGEAYSASTGGLEYSFVGVFGSRADLGIVIEYMYDERGEDANHFFQDDIGLGLRLALNDTQSTEVLLGLVRDNESDAQVWSLEASRRLGENWKLNLEGNLFRHIPDGDILFGFKHDDNIRIEISWYF